MRRPQATITKATIFGLTAMLAVPGMAGAAQASAAAPNLLLQVSKAPGRTAPVALDRAKLSGKVYVLLGGDVTSVASVTFRLDSAVGAVRKVDKAAPFDLAGAVADGTAAPFDTATLTEGRHAVLAEVVLKSGAEVNIYSRFDSANKPNPSPSPSSPAPSASPSAQPSTTPSTSPSTQPSTTPGSWVKPGSVGVKVATSKKLGGVTIDDTAWFATNKFPGSGTKADPFLVDRVLFTGTVTLGGWDRSDVTGKYVKFTNCRFYGNPANPTPGGSAFVHVRDTGPFVTVEDSTLAPNATELPTGGPPASVGGVDKGIFSYVPFTLRRSEVWGANIGVGFETEQSEGASLVEDNWIHDTWSSAGDHTDLINGNFHASHVTVRGNYLDGHRTGGSKVTNAIGIYNDTKGCDGCSSIEDWTVVNNFFDRSATGILATTNATRFAGPFVVTGNRFGAGVPEGRRLISRTPTEEKSNTDDSGRALNL